MPQRFRRSGRWAATLFCAITSIPWSAPAQVLYGSILGSVSDAAGASVPGAKVRITSAGTHQTRESVTDDAGNYAFPSIPGGSYEIAITKPGFQTYTVRNVTVSADSKIRVDAVLNVGTVEQSVEVSAQSA